MNAIKGPFFRSKNSTNKMMIHLLVALTPIILFSFYKYGIKPFYHSKTNFLGLIYPLIFILLSAATTFITETLYEVIVNKKRNEELRYVIYNHYSFFPGLFLALILPINTPLLILIMGGIFAILIGKMAFGGFGNNIFNPALIGYIFISTCYASVLSSSYLSAYEIDTLSSATPLSNAVEALNYTTLVKPYGSLFDFFIGNIPGSIGEVSSLLILVAFGYLAFNKVIKWRITITYLFTFFIMTTLISSLANLGMWYPFYHLFSGGLLFGSVFMATDPVTSPTTPIGQTLYGFFLGILTIIARFLTPYPEGVMTSILTMNMFVFILDGIGSKGRFNFFRAFIFFVIAWGLILELSIHIGSGLRTSPSDATDNKYNIISKETIADQTTYIATYEGYQSKLKAKIVIEANKVTTYEILEQNDSFYHMTSDVNYIDKLLKSNDLANVDTVSGATYTSNALKKLLLLTKEDYQKDNGKIIENNDNILDSPEIKNYELISEQIENNNYVYHVSSKGFSSNIVLKIVISANQIIGYEVLEQNDSYFNVIIANNYLDTLAINQNDIETVDVISGATYTSNALKNIFKGILGYHKEKYE